MCLTLLSSWSFAQTCNRAHPDDGDYVQPWEFCDDDLRGHKLPRFDDYPADKVEPFTPMLPKRFEGPDAENNAAWMEAIRYAFKSGNAVFAGHYLFVESGSCGGGCHRAIIVDLKDGKVYEPLEIQLVLASVNTLPDTMCTKLETDCVQTLTFRPNSKLLLMIGQLGEGAKRRGLYYFQLEDNKLKPILKIDKSLTEKRQKHAK